MAVRTHAAGRKSGKKTRLSKKGDPSAGSKSRGRGTAKQKNVGKWSRNKGARGEREAAERLHALFGWRAKRAQQHSGTESSADVLVQDTPGLWFEVKRVQRLCVPKAMSTATEQSGRKCPVLLHRVDQGDWLLTINLADLPRLCHAYECATSEQMAAPQVPGAAASGYPSGKTTGQLARDLLVEQGQGTNTALSGIRVNDVRDSLGGVGTRSEGRMPNSVRGGQ